jgi:hypothetical protein
MGKNNSHHITFLLLIVLSLVASETFSQDTGSPSFEAYDRGPLEGVIFNLGDTVESRAQLRDSLAINNKLQRNVYKPSSVVPKEKNKSEESNDNSILSFNFLYYLIQKYKMQDIVD